ncbi:MAG: radical SAM protein [Deltaproteobacteria bacterium]|nr:radical SAM protein [Deltaproteobacteria bacterium]
MTFNSLFTLSEKQEIPLEAVLKSDLLRLGVSFSQEALKASQDQKPKSYFIFSFDRVSQKELSEMEKKGSPEEIALVGGPYHLKRTIVSVRLNPDSPYRIEASPPPLPLSLVRRGGRGERSEKICDITLPISPPYYKTPLKSGKPVADIAPTIEWGYLIYLTAFRLCQYWGEKEECQFCDINNNYRQQKGERSYTSIKEPDEVVEALAIIQKMDTSGISQAYTVSGGAITKDLYGLREAEFYARYAEAIEKNFPGRWIGKANVQALPKEEVKILKKAGYQIYHPNYEVWDKELFKRLCPGKEKLIGQEEWIHRILSAAEIFGASHVIPNFVAGIEMSKPYGFQTVDEAVDSTAEGLDFFMSKGILPRFTVWCVEPNTILSQTNSEPPPLEYFVKLLRVYRETFKRHKLPYPKGYGEPGVGKAVFSVSPFMDVI